MTLPRDENASAGVPPGSTAAGTDAERYEAAARQARDEAARYDAAARTARNDTPQSDVARSSSAARPTGATTVSRPAAVGAVDESRAQIAMVPLRDRVRWGPIVAGLVTTLTTLLLLSMLGVGIGATTFESARAPNPTTIGLGSAIVSGAIALIAFFVGGYVAGRTAAVIGHGAGALNGFLVWALGVTLILVLGTIGLASLLGSAGSMLGNINPNTQVNPGEAASTIRNSALVSFVSLALPAIAATAGGWLGARTDVDEVVTETERTA